MNSLRTILAMALVLMGAQAMAQNSTLHFPSSNGDNHTQCVKVSLKSVWRSSPTISYEHTLAPGKGSVEGTFGWFTSGESNRLHGALIKAGYKWTFPIGEKSKALSQGGYLCSGFYIKPELSYVYRARPYESFTYNDGWDMYYDVINYHDHNASLMLQLGFQVNWTHFFLEYSFGAGSYWSTNAFNQGWTYAYTALGHSTSGLSTYNTLKIGFPF